MNDSAFLETNILVYAHTDFDTPRQLINCAKANRWYPFFYQHPGFTGIGKYTQPEI
jgi:hypothetical protein